MVVIHRFGEVTNDAIVQGPFADGLIRVCGNEDCRNFIARLHEMSVELNASHSGHLNVGDQAAGFGKEGRGQEIGCRGERFDRVAQGPYEFSHGFSKGLIILHNRYQWMLRHRGFLGAAYRRPIAPAVNCSMSAKVGNKAMPALLSDGLGVWLFA